MTDMSRENKTISIMIDLYCRDNHGKNINDCQECTSLLNYALKRIENCPLKDNKPPCSSCHIHCYKKYMREKIRKVMRYAGPRMMVKHPVLAVKHLIDGNKPYQSPEDD